MTKENCVRGIVPDDRSCHIASCDEFDSCPKAAKEVLSARRGGPFRGAVPTAIQIRGSGREGH